MSIPMKQPYTFENPPQDDLAGLRNKVRMICRAAADGDLREAHLQADDLLDSLFVDVSFSWNSPTAEEAEAQRRRDVAAFVAECPTMVD